MGLEYMKNTRTGEIKLVDTVSDEYDALVKQVYESKGEAVPAWQITNLRVATKPKAHRRGSLVFLYPDDQAGALTQAEIKAGGTTPNDKIARHRATFADFVPGKTKFPIDGVDPVEPEELVESVEPEPESVEPEPDRGDSESAPQRQARRVARRSRRPVPSAGESSESSEQTYDDEPEE